MRVEYDKNITDALRKGDETAFEQLYETCFPRLFEYSKSITGSHDAAYEIVQSLFVALWENRRKLDPIESPVNYLLRAVHNNSLRYLRTHRTRDRHHLIIRDIQPQNYTPDEPDENHEYILRLIDTLSERSRQIVRMKYTEGRKSSEIADELNISVRTVETTLYKAIKKIRKK